MSGENHFNDELVKNEVERIQILFSKNNYGAKEKLWFIQSKVEYAKASNDELLLKACNIILNELNKAKS